MMLYIVRVTVALGCIEGACAGLFKPLFAGLEKSTDPFYCPHCQLRNLNTEISSLKETIKSLIIMRELLHLIQSAVSSSDQTANISPKHLQLMHLNSNNL